MLGGERNRGEDTTFLFDTSDKPTVAHLTKNGLEKCWLSELLTGHKRAKGHKKRKEQLRQVAPFPLRFEFLKETPAQKG